MGHTVLHSLSLREINDFGSRILFWGFLIITIVQCPQNAILIIKAPGALEFLGEAPLRLRPAAFGLCRQDPCSSIALTQSHFSGARNEKQIALRGDAFLPFAVELGIMSPFLFLLNASATNDALFLDCLSKLVNLFTSCLFLEGAFRIMLLDGVPGATPIHFLCIYLLRKDSSPQPVQSCISEGVQGVLDEWGGDP